jgi:chemotaxis protein MotB
MSSDIQQCPPCDKGAPRWVTTFGDLMSLLLCFFVLLLSFSEIDR